MPKISCLPKPVESRLDKEDSLPLEEGRKAGNYSIFFREFLRIIVGLL